MSVVKCNLNIRHKSMTIIQIPPDIGFFLGGGSLNVDVFFNAPCTLVFVSLTSKLGSILYFCCKREMFYIEGGCI